MIRGSENGHFKNLTVHVFVPKNLRNRLTAFGASLEPILLLMRDWGDNYMAQLVAIRRERADRVRLTEVAPQ